LANGASIAPSHLISALPTPQLYQLLAPSFRGLKPFEYLTVNPTSSVHVVNIVFPGNPSTIHPAGFGYLVPRPPQGYPSSPGEGLGILGTVFDSCSVSAQDISIAEKTGNVNAEFTKLTVMIGGPYPVPQMQEAVSSSDVNQSSPQAEYVERILKQLSIHLSQQLPSPIYWRIHSNVHCIPTLLPGHLERMSELRECLSSEFGNQFQIVGAGVGGVSVGDCVEGGRAAALLLAEY
jgi:oxygen-dependent protoporphyrinogen oxidase